MNKLTYFISVLVVCLACYGDAFCQEQNTTDQTPDAPPSKSEESSAAAVAEANALPEPNSITEQPAVEEPKSRFIRLKRRYRTEQRQWMQGDLERRPQLLDAVHERWLGELEILRDAALEEEAQETVATIDELMASGNTRYEGIKEELQDERRKGRFERKSKKEQQREDRRRRRNESREEKRRGRKSRSRSEEY